MYLTANDGFHRGTKVASRDRVMLTADYVVHKEFYGTQDVSLFQLPSSEYQNLSPREQALADFLRVV